MSSIVMGRPFRYSLTQPTFHYSYQVIKFYLEISRFVNIFVDKYDNGAIHIKPFESKRAHTI